MAFINDNDAVKDGASASVAPVNESVLEQVEMLGWPRTLASVPADILDLI